MLVIPRASEALGERDRAEGKVCFLAPCSSKRDLQHHHLELVRKVESQAPPPTLLNEN